MTARDDIDALIKALEDEAVEARQVAEDREQRAQALREFAGEKEEAPAAVMSFTSIGHTTVDRLAHDADDAEKDDLRTYQDTRDKE